MEQDLRLRLRCLVVKGDVDLDLDAQLAERDWTEALEIAAKLKDDAWMNRATGELGIISFLDGDSRKATLMVAGTLTKAQALNDVGAQVRYLTLIGEGLVEWQRYEPALKMFDQAIDLARRTPDLGDPIMAYDGKATALVAMDKISDARVVCKPPRSCAKETGRRVRKRSSRADRKAGGEDGELPAGNRQFARRCFAGTGSQRLSTRH